MAEQLVCNDPLLSLDDERLAKVYQRALKRPAGADALRRQQRRWVAQRRDRCTDLHCLRDAYAHRTAELGALEGALTSTDLAACLIAADHASRGELEKLAIASQLNPSDQRIRKLFAPESEAWFQGYMYWSVDLNGDHVPDHLAITVEGTMRDHTAYARSGRKGAAVTTLTKSTDYADDIDLRVLKVGAQHYILSGYDQTVSMLWRLKGDEFAPLCGFKPRPEPLVEQVRGGQDPVCLATNHEQREPADFSLPHGLGTLPDELRFWSKRPIDGLAQIDIDNDGHADNLVRIDFTHGGGRGCDAQYLAVTDDTQAHLPDTWLNQLLLDELGGRPCGPNLSAFTYEGTAFVEADHGVGTLSVFEIRNGKAHPRCEFRGRRIYDIDTLSLDP
jgi:uncharacterized protein YecT (DUF1311 family)